MIVYSGKYCGEEPDVKPSVATFPAQASAATKPNPDRVAVKLSSAERGAAEFLCTGAAPCSTAELCRHTSRCSEIPQATGAGILFYLLHNH